MTKNKFAKWSAQLDDPLKPSLALLAKLGSAIVHADEYLGGVSLVGHPMDRIAFNNVLRDPEVQKWLTAMKVYLPVKR